MMEFPDFMRLIILGLAAGVLSGLFGIGGGLVIVPALVLLFGFGTKTAVGTSLFVILLPTGLLGVLEYWKNGELKVAAGLWIALGVFCGAYFGARMAGAVSAITMKRLYAVFLLVVAVYFLLGPQTGKDNAVGKPAPSRVPGATDQGHAVD
jgi:uncharacterized membrane protein YfcA